MKSVFITGGSGGIGGACARAFAADGWAVAIGYNTGEGHAQALKAELLAAGHTAEIYRADVKNSGELSAAIHAAEKDFGFISALVNAAGSAQDTLFQDITDDEWDACIATNLSGTFFACRAVLPAMIREKRGCIVNIGSVWGLQGAACEAAYSAAKAGVEGLTKALAKEVAPSGIRVNCVAPGVIATAMNAQHSSETMQALADETPLGRIGTPDEVAAAVLFFAGEGAGFITGQTLTVDGGFIL